AHGGGQRLFADTSRRDVVRVGSYPEALCCTTARRAPQARAIPAGCGQDRRGMSGICGWSGAPEADPEQVLRSMRERIDAAGPRETAEIVGTDFALAAS